MSRILIVEDNAMNRTLLREVLRTRGHEIVEATTIDEGRERLRQDTPDLVLLDIQVPGGGGETLLAEIRREPETARLCVVAVTAYAMRGDRERFLALGFDAYVSKPIDTRTFGALVESLLAAHEEPAGS